MRIFLLIIQPCQVFVWFLGSHQKNSVKIFTRCKFYYCCNLILLVSSSASWCIYISSNVIRLSPTHLNGFDLLVLRLLQEITSFVYTNRNNLLQLKQSSEILLFIAKLFLNTRKLLMLVKQLSVSSFIFWQNNWVKSYIETFFFTVHAAVYLLLELIGNWIISIQLLRWLRKRKYSWLL